MIYKGSRLTPRKIAHALENSCYTMLIVVSACAAAGLIVTSVGMTGLGIRFSSAVVGWCGGTLALLLPMAAVASFILGMGVTAIACYIMVALLAAPAITQLEVPPIAGHLFVLYWGLISMITPLVAIAVFAAAGIAGSNFIKTGFQAMRLAIIAYVVPFMFVYKPALLMIGSPAEIAVAAITSIIGCIAFASGISGYLLRKTN